MSRRRHRSSDCDTLIGVVIFLFLAYLLAKKDEGVNQENENEQENKDMNRFATKTPYNNRYRHQEYNQRDDEYLRANCTLAHIIQVTRHGTRFPSKKQIRKLERLRTRLLSSSHGKEHLPSVLFDWTNKFSSEFEKVLSAVGHEELFTMGQRFHERYEERMKLSQDTLRFISSELSRAKESALAFMKGLPLLFDASALEENEKLVRYFAYCQRYQTAIKKNKTALIEYYNFLRGPEIDAVVNDVRNRFNLTDIDLTSDDLELIFVSCGFEVANNVSAHEDSPWCQMLLSDQFAVLEYLQDLKQYWRKSYPYKLNYLQSCPLVSDILNNLHDAIAKDEGKPGSATLYFGHAETLIPVVTALGLFRDDAHLRANNMADMGKRRFRTSMIAPFAGNVALELYRCLAPNQPQIVLRPLVNEHPVHWDLCNAGFCPYDMAERHLSICAPTHHNQDDMCAKSGHVHDEL